VSLHITARARYEFLHHLISERLRPPAAIVELGAAPGDQVCALADAGFATTAVDIGIASDGWADNTEGRMLRLFKEHGVAFVEWDLEQVPYPLPDSAFDGVVFTEVFEHLRDYPVRSLQECARILRPGGYLFFTTPNAGYVMNRLRLLRGRSVYTPMQDWIGGVPHARHAREYLFSEVEQAMGIAGLDVVLRTSRHFHVADKSRVRRRVKRAIDLLARSRNTLGPLIVMVAQKPAD
jgi:SAM-dependent methyltransferase